MSVKLKKTNNDLTLSVEEWKKTKSDKVLERIINNHYPMIYSIINNINVGYEISKDDLFSEGVLGILTALDKFEINKNAKFSTYAYFWVRSKIYKFLKKIHPLEEKSQSKNTINDLNHSIFENSEEILSKPLRSRKIQSLEDSDLKWTRFTNHKELENNLEDQDVVSIINYYFYIYLKKNKLLLKKDIYPIKNILLLKLLSLLDFLVKESDKWKKKHSKNSNH